MVNEYLHVYNWGRHEKKQTKRRDHNQMNAHCDIQRQGNSALHITSLHNSVSIKCLIEKAATQLKLRHVSAKFFENLINFVVVAYYI